MSKISLNWEEAHDFVEKNQSKGFFWDGYTIVRWSPSNNGLLQKNGMYKNNKWGYATRFKVNDKGRWELPDKYANFI